MYSSSVLEVLIVLALAAGITAWLLPVSALPPTPVVSHCVLTNTSVHRAHAEQYWFNEQGAPYCEAP